MAEFKKLPTQEELQKMLYMGQLQGKSNEDIINENLARGTTIKALPESFFTTAGAGARQAGQFVNRAGTAQDIAKLFPGYTGQTKVSIPTSYNFAGKMDPSTGQVMPSGLQTQQIPYGDILKAIKPADVLGLTGTSQAYSDIGAGKAPNVMDVLDTVGLGAVMAKPAQLGFKAGKGLLEATKGLPVGMSIQDISKNVIYKVFNQDGYEIGSFLNKEDANKFALEGKYRKVSAIDASPIEKIKNDEDKLRIYRGSYEDVPIYKVEENYKGNDIFGGVFGSPSLSSAESHGGGAVHYTEIPKNKILTQSDLNYQIPFEDTKKALLKARPDLKNNSELFDEVYNIVINDSGLDLYNYSDDFINKAFKTTDFGEAEFEAQRLRGQVSKNLGYKAVEVMDEHGTSYLVAPGAQFKKVNKLKSVFSSGGNVKPAGLLGNKPINNSMQLNEANQVASKNAEKMLGLPPGNTAMDRASAMEFNLDIPLYRGTTKPEVSHIGQDVYATTDPKSAEFYATNFSTLQNAINKGLSPNIMPLYGSKEFVQPNTGSNLWSGGSGYQIPAKYIRSKFAAFDPARANEADLLAGVIPFGLLSGKDQLESKKKKKSKK